MQIFCQNLRGLYDTYEVEPTTTIRELRVKVEMKTGVPLRCQRLLFAGKALGGNAEDDDDERNEYTIASYNIQKESHLHMIMRLAGS